MPDCIFPSVLEAHRRKQYFLAIAVSLLAFFVLTATHSAKSLLLFLPAIYMFFLGFSLERKFNLGCITERVVSCESVHRSLMRNKTYVTFLTTDDDPEWLKMAYPGTDIIGEMIPNALYVIYYDTLLPTRLMAYVHV